MKKSIRELKAFLILWSTQSLSQLGSAMTGFALTLWVYDRTGSALQTALMSICSYAPYVLMSIFAGALSDRWDKKKTMLVCDTLAACCTVTVLVLLQADLLRPGHIYLLNAVNGLMNTVQQPASEVAMTALAPKEQYQKVGGLKSLSNSLVTVLHPVFATALYAFGGMGSVIWADLGTFAAAFIALALFIRLPAVNEEGERQPVLAAAREGLEFLRQNGLILTLILFLAGVNLVASAFDAVLPAYVLPRENGGETVLGAVMSSAGLAMLAGSLLATALPAPKDRVRVIWLSMIFSLGTENYLLAFTRTPVWWCLAQAIGWITVPVMNANLDAVMRSGVPAAMQGRVYACRNTLQFFTIPVGFFLGGAMVDKVCEPVMAARSQGALAALFGTGKGSGAAMMMFILGVAGTLVCLVFGKLLKKYR